MTTGIRTHGTLPGSVRASWRRWWVLVVVTVLLPLACWAEDPGQALEAKYGLYPDFAANVRVQVIGQRVARAAKLDSPRFAVINDRELNAMALPDGRIYITSLMASLVTDDELAFVLGHEITHIKENHARGQQARATGGSLLGAILAAALGGSQQDIRMGADIVGGLTYGHYSRKDENRADAGGVKYMTVAGYDPRRAANAMQRLIDQYGRGDAGKPVLGWFASHPDTKNRKKRLVKLADDLKKAPLEKLPEPLGVIIALEASAEHARAWAPDYVAQRLAMYGQGQVTVQPAEQPSAMWAKAGETLPEATMPKEKDAPLPAVKLAMLGMPGAYRARLSLRAMPAGGAATIAKGQGTAVEAILEWTDLRKGFTGVCRGTAQTHEDLPWMAQQQLKDETLLRKLREGKTLNVEGTLEAAAIRRAAMAFAEVLESDAPIDHSAPVTLKLSSGHVRVGDYVDVIRGDRIVSAVRVDKVDGRAVTGSVLWGVHTWQTDDKFEPAD